MFERSRKGENALLIQPHLRGPVDEGALEEFADLTRSAGARIVAQIDARIDRPNPATLIGSGKLEEVKAACEATGADLVLVNHPLSPVQERNLEKALERRVVDRTGLILDIFSQRARSAEGKLQVELAQLKHMATRLVRGWTHLERQRGGSIGLRGPGETQLETDRRLLQKRVTTLQKRLEKVEVQHTQMRRARVRSEMPRVALVGYTNAGKSTLFNAMTGAEAYADDRLFATLDPTVRRLVLPTGNTMLADTVGFVRDLPHDLVAAFRSTLSEAREADLLLHVIDAADPLRDERIAQVDAVLEEIGAGDIPQLLVYNKIDKVGIDETPSPVRGEPVEPHPAEASDVAGTPSTPALRAYAQGERDSTNLKDPVRPEPFDSAQDRLREAKSKDPQSTKISPVRPQRSEAKSKDPQSTKVSPVRPERSEAKSKDSTTATQPAINPRHDNPGNGFDGSHAGAARERVWLSARDGTGLDLLRNALGQRLGLRRIQGELRLPNDAGRLRAQLHELGAVRDERQDEDGWWLRLDLAEADAARLATQDDSTQLRTLLTTQSPL